MSSFGRIMQINMNWYSNQVQKWAWNGHTLRSRMEGNTRESLELNPLGYGKVGRTRAEWRRIVIVEVHDNIWLTPHLLIIFLYVVVYKHVVIYLKNFNSFYTQNCIGIIVFYIRFMHMIYIIDNKYKSLSYMFLTAFSYFFYYHIKIII